MSGLKIFEDAKPKAAIVSTTDVDVIARELSAIGVQFERWESPVSLSPDDSAEVILNAYKPYLDQLMGAKGAGSADVVKLTPDNPNVAALRQKFLAEHIHTEDEIRFFVHGSGHFVMHVNDRVYDAFCERGDLISVPANTKHWFDAGEKPFFTALRVFTDTSGWVAHFTGDNISERFPVA
ncbi:MAG: acireductone dioxygenase [Acidocella sp. 20-57-95]|nr:MAG: acireductone dioxygenase [Acidocella sp. 20-57-95]HQT63638.1 cupin domain-containing protein [Acidocella sp.]